MLSFINKLWKKDTSKLENIFPGFKAMNKSDFFWSLTSIQNLQDVKEVFLGKTHKNLVDTSISISPCLASFNSSISTIISLLGKPVHQFNNGNSIKNHQVLFYEDEFNGIPFLVQLHFLNQVLFYAEEIFPQHEEHNKLLKIYAFKYNVHSLKKHQTITNKVGNKVTFEANGTFKVKYYTANHAIYDNLQKQVWGIIKVKEQNVPVFIPALG